jgi:hypothetical protein
VFGSLIELWKLRLGTKILVKKYIRVLFSQSLMTNPKENMQLLIKMERLIFGELMRII